MRDTRVLIVVAEALRFMPFAMLPVLDALHPRRWPPSSRAPSAPVRCVHGGGLRRAPGPAPLGLGCALVLFMEALKELDLSLMLQPMGYSSPALKITTPSRASRTWTAPSVWVLITQALMLLPLLLCWWRMNRLGTNTPVAPEWNAMLAVDRCRARSDHIGGNAGVLRQPPARCSPCSAASGGGKTSLLRTRASKCSHAWRRAAAAAGVGRRQRCGWRPSGAACSLAFPGRHLVCPSRRGGAAWHRRCAPRTKATRLARTQTCWDMGTVAQTEGATSRRCRAARRSACPGAAPGRGRETAAARRALRQRRPPDAHRPAGAAEGQLAHGVGAIVITHDPQDVIELGARVLLMRERPVGGRRLACAIASGQLGAWARSFLLAGAAA